MTGATIKDVARRADVSVASVSRALNDPDSVAEPTRQRVLEAVEALRYVPHGGARSLITRRTDTVGVILPDLFGEFFSELIRGLDVAARERGLHLIVSSSHDDAEEAAAAIRSMRGRVDGLIVLSPHLDSANLARGLTGDLPILLMNGPDPERPSIVLDNHGGAVAMVRHLREAGCRRIAHIAGPQGNLDAEARLAGYHAALAEAGQAPLVANGDFTRAGGYRAAEQLLAGPERPDGLFVANDIMAVGCLLAIQAAGLTCPDDVAVGGFDDVPVAELVHPALTTMRVNIADTGRRALMRLADIIAGGPGDGPLSEIVRPLLVVRNSTKRDAGDRENAPARREEQGHA